MLSAPRFNLWMVSCLSWALLLSLAAPTCADPKPLSKEEQAKVEKAVEEGIAFLKRRQTDAGEWPRPMVYWNDKYLVGLTILTAYGLLEADVPAKDPAIQKAAEYIRSRVLKSEQTYELALGVLFFDRLGDPNDKKLIRTLALRLVAGQHRTGGWNYRCPSLREEDEAPLIRSLRELTKLLRSEVTLDARALNGLHVPHELKPLTVFQDPKRLRWVEPRSSEFSHQSQLFVGATDNSNTQFAMLALWVAQRHGIPVEPTFRLMVERFEMTQRQDGWWPYDFRFDRRDTIGPLPSMICVGLLGLAIGHGLTPERLGAAPRPPEDSRVENGLAALYREIGHPTRQMDIPVPFAIKNSPLYFLWSVERVAMLYNLPTVGDKDWFRWGAEMIVTNQKANGEWVSSYGPVAGTSFALLFLKRSHPMKDLTPKLPYNAKELNQRIIRLGHGGSRLERPKTTPSDRDSKPER